MNRVGGRLLALLSWVLNGVLFFLLGQGLFDDPSAYTAPLSAGAVRFIAGCFAAAGVLLALPATQGTVRLFCLLLFLPFATVVPGGLTPFWGISAFLSFGLLLSVLQVWGLAPDRYLASDNNGSAPSDRPSSARAIHQFLLSALIGIGMVLGVLGIHRLGREYLASWFGGGLPQQRTGLSAFMDLGAIDELKKSDRILFHVRGDSPDLLRVRAFSIYQNGRWVADGRAAVPVALVGEAISGVGDLAFRRVSGRDAWLALPSELGRIWSDIPLESDRGGGVRGARGRSPDRWVWMRGGTVVPSDSDPLGGLLEVPAHLREFLSEKAGAWSGRSDTELRAQLESLSAGLQGGTRYALSFQRTPGVDPVLDFLTVHPLGNCEAYASAFALLARTIGIPSRVVTGFRVHERNPLSGHWLVREWDAHAWVEAHVDGRWVAWDPTPAVLGVESQSASFTRIHYMFDAFRAQALRGWDRIFDMTLAEIAFVVLALGGVLVGYQLKRNAGRRRTRLGLRAESVGALPQLERLEGQLRELGYVRLRGETLLGFSRRLELAGGDLAVHGEWIRNYAAWRYGGVGTSSDLERSFTEVLR